MARAPARGAAHACRRAPRLRGWSLRCWPIGVRPRAAAASAGRRVRGLCPCFRRCLPLLCLAGPGGVPGPGVCAGHSPRAAVLLLAGHCRVDASGHVVQCFRPRSRGCDARRPGAQVSVLVAQRRARPRGSGRPLAAVIERVETPMCSCLVEASEPMVNALARADCPPGTTRMAHATRCPPAALSTPSSSPGTRCGTRQLPAARQVRRCALRCSGGSSSSIPEAGSDPRLRGSIRCLPRTCLPPGRRRCWRLVGQWARAKDRNAAGAGGGLQRHRAPIRNSARWPPGLSEASPARGVRWPMATWPADSGRCPLCARIDHVLVRGSGGPLAPSASRWRAPTTMASWRSCPPAAELPEDLSSAS